MQLRLELQKPLGLFLLEPLKGHTSHLADDLGDDFLIDQPALGLRLLTPCLLDVFLLLAHLLRLIAQLGRTLVVGSLDRLVLLDRKTLDLALDLSEVRRLAHALDPNTRTRLVQHINRLVRLHPTHDVPPRQLNRRLERIVGDLHPVVILVLVADPLENLDRLIGRGLVHSDRLESASQGRVLLDVLAVLVERRRSDALNLATRQGRLEHVGRIDRALGAASANKRVQLINKQDHVLGPAHLAHDGLDPLLKLTAVLRARDHHRKIKNHQTLLMQNVRHLARDDPLAQALDDRGLTNARLAQKHRVVLRAAAKHLHQTLDLALTPDHRVQLLALGKLGQVTPERVQSRGLALALAGCAGFAPAAAR